MRPSFSGLLANTAELDPPKVLQEIRDKITIKAGSSLCPEDATKPQPANTLRLVCVSDTHTAHGVLTDLPDGDVLIHAGDFSDVGKARDIDSFCSWLESLKSKYRHRVVIAGNHDLSLDKESYHLTYRRFGHTERLDVNEQIEKLRSCCTYLDHEAIDIDGVRFFGSPYQPWFYDWAFNLSRDGECRAKWSSMPTNVDVLITHGPPLGHGDICVGNGAQGCADLLDWVEAHPPKAHIFGHIHEGYGVTNNDKTAFVNASTMNYNYDVTKPNPPIVIDVPMGAASVATSSS